MGQSVQWCPVKGGALLAALIKVHALYIIEVSCTYCMCQFYNCSHYVSSCRTLYTDYIYSVPCLISDTSVMRACMSHHINYTAIILFFLIIILLSLLINTCTV